MLYPAVNSSSQPKRKRTDFYFFQTIGEGSYSKVYRCAEKGSNQTYAIKQVSKRLLMREGKERYAFREKKALSLLSSSPYFVHLYFTFQDDDSLYYGLSYYPGGDLLDLILKYGRLRMPCLIFYSAELIDAIVFMHSQRIIHRDLKPENVLMDEENHIKITDFGSCRILDEGEHDEALVERNEESSAQGVDNAVQDNDVTSDERPSARLSPMQRRPRSSHSMVGTAQFVAPEILKGHRVGYGCDFWSLGCVIYQMYTGSHLFQGYHEYDVLHKACRAEYKLDAIADYRVKDLISNLVVLNPMRRYGTLDEGLLRNHELFRATVWTNLHLQIPPSPTLE